MDIGEFCQRTYEAEIARFNYSEWFYGVIETRERTTGTLAGLDDLFLRIQDSLSLSRAERDVVFKLIYRPSDLFTVGGELYFEIERMMANLEAVACHFLHYPLPPPHGAPLPRRIIAATKQKVMRLAKLRIAPSGDIGGISDGIIKACWNYRQSLITSKEIHTIHRRPHKNG